MITEINGKNPVHMHGFIIPGLKQYIQTGKNQRNGNSRQPHIGRRDIVHQKTQNMPEKPEEQQQKQKAEPHLTCACEEAGIGQPGRGMYLTINGNCKIGRERHQCNDKKINRQIHANRNCGDAMITQIQNSH